MELDRTFGVFDVKRAAVVSTKVSPPHRAALDGG
jgi:hypothetical protein